MNKRKILIDNNVLSILSIIISMVNIYFVYHVTIKTKNLVKKLKEQRIEQKLDERDTEQIIKYLRKLFDYKEK